MKQYKFKINGNEYNVAVNSVSGNIADVTVNGTSYQVEMDNAPEAPVQAAPAVQSASSVSVPVAVPHPAAKSALSGTGKSVKSPLPGVIISVNVKVGDIVKEGQVLAVLEAMKMENEIQAEYNGIVTSVLVAKGDSVLEGAAIVTLA